MIVTPEAVAHLAWLARLELRPDEARGLQRDLEGILEYVRVLDGVATDGIEATPASDAAPALREDRVRAGVTQEQALANAPERIGEFFAVPPVVERM
jgi:aspartyl-tRNA(Asn)/glutamyl-tRNA(Gln) amidotransferase subunit C